MKHGEHYSVIVLIIIHAVIHLFHFDARAQSILIYGSYYSCVLIIPRIVKIAIKLVIETPKLLHLSLQRFERVYRKKFVLHLHFPGGNLTSSAQLKMAQ